MAHNPLFYCRFVQAFDYNEYQQWSINHKSTDISDKQDDMVQEKGTKNGLEKNWAAADAYDPE